MAGSLFQLAKFTQTNSPKQTKGDLIGEQITIIYYLLLNIQLYVHCICTKEHTHHCNLCPHNEG